MPRDKAREENSPLEILTELAVEGTSSLTEAQRALLSLAQRENEILCNGVKERLGGFLPGVAMSDLVRRSLDTFVGLQGELLTAANKQALDWLELSQAGKKDRSAHLVAFAREGVESFTRAQKKFLDVVEEETGRALSGKHPQEHKPAKKTELAQLAREATDGFIQAQKRLLDVIHQQMKVNLDLTTRSVAMMNPSRLLPVANRTGEEVRSFLDREASLVGSFMKPKEQKVIRRKKVARKRIKEHEMVTA